jgi:hypothetical protein
MITRAMTHKNRPCTSSGLDDGVNVQGTCMKKKPDTRRIEIREIQALFSRNDIFCSLFEEEYTISYNMSIIMYSMSFIIDSSSRHRGL